MTTSKDLEEITGQLSAVVAAKEVFLSALAESAVVTDLFGSTFWPRLKRMEEETEEEAEELRTQMRDWAQSLASAGRSEAAWRAARTTRHDMLMALYTAKEAMADALRQIASQAPDHEMRDALRHLAEVDERHARELVRMVAYEDQPEANPVRRRQS